jgi:hypothetical protein
MVSAGHRHGCIAGGGYQQKEQRNLQGNVEIEIKGISDNFFLNKQDVIQLMTPAGNKPVLKESPLRPLTFKVGKSVGSQPMDKDAVVL